MLRWRSGICCVYSAAPPHSHNDHRCGKSAFVGEDSGTTKSRTCRQPHTIQIVRLRRNGHKRISLPLVISRFAVAVWALSGDPVVSMTLTIKKRKDVKPE